MAYKKVKRGKAQMWASLDDALAKAVPSARKWWESDEDFRELRIKLRPDGTYLAIAKGYGPDGGEVICFANGYGLAAAVMALDSSIQGGNWRVDTPWEERASKKGKVG